MHPAITRGLLALAVATRLAGQSAPALRPTRSAADVDPLHQTGENVTVSLLTMGNGNQVWELFGHTAIAIHDNVSGRDTVFNWGVFDPRVPHFIAHFLQGLNYYQMGGETLNQLLANYRYMNRTVVSQELALLPAQKDSLLHLIQVNAQPENLQYRYDYFQDNCATRPRDLLDRVLGGQLHAKANGLTGTTYRWQALRLMQGDKPLVVGVNIGLGEPSDVELTKWQTMFLPRALHDFVGSILVANSSGVTVPLVIDERVLYQSTRPVELDAPPKMIAWLLPLGIVVALLFAWLAVRAASGSRAARVVAAVVMSIWCTVAGLLGVVLTLLWSVTDHIFAHRNENLLLLNPLWLVLAVLVVLSIGRGRASRVTYNLAVTLAGFCVLALVTHVVLLSRQANLAIIALALPPALVIAWATNPNRLAR
ncbi:MAG: DUF4105 domain-containing protein [bacterium]